MKSITLRNKIKDILELIVDETGTRTIKVVYNYPESKPSGYPYVYLTYNGYESEELTNTQERVIHKFEINLIQEKIEELKGRANAESTTMERSDEISEALRQSDDLDLDILRLRPISSEKEYIENATRIKLRIEVECETIENIKI